MRSFRALLALPLALWGLPAHAATVTQVATAACTTAVSSCTATLSSNVSAGSVLLVVGTFGTSTGTYTFADSASDTFASCGKASSNNGTPFAAIVASSAGMASGTGTVTVTNGSASNKWAIQVFTVTGITGVCDAIGTAVTGTWTSGSATTFATSPALHYSSEWVLSVVSVQAGAAADIMASYTGGYTATSSYTTGTNDPEQFLSSQTLTSGTATAGGTPTSSAGRNYNAVVFTFPNSGSTFNSRPTRTLLGVGQ